MASTRNLPPDRPKTSLAKPQTPFASGPGARGKWAATVALHPLPPTLLTHHFSVVSLTPVREKHFPIT